MAGFSVTARRRDHLPDFVFVLRDGPALGRQSRRNDADQAGQQPLTRALSREKALSKADQFGKKTFGKNCQKILEEEKNHGA